MLEKARGIAAGSILTEVKINMTKLNKRKTKRMRETLEGLYERYNWRRYVPGDPLMFLYDFTDVKDSEIVALVSSSLESWGVRRDNS